jgi:hypothetical protein
VRGVIVNNNNPAPTQQSLTSTQTEEQYTRARHRLTAALITFFKMSCSFVCCSPWPTRKLKMVDDGKATPCCCCCCCCWSCVTPTCSLAPFSCFGGRTVTRPGSTFLGRALGGRPPPGHQVEVRLNDTHGENNKRVELSLAGRVVAVRGHAQEGTPRGGSGR